MSHPPAAGMFVLAELGGPLREVLFPSAIDETGVEIWVRPGHPLTQLLPGANVDLLGPLGRGFRVGNISRLLLVAEVDNLPPLLPLLSAAPEVAVMVEIPTRAQMPPLDRFPLSVELHLVSLDGSAGYLGPLESDDIPPSGLERARSRLLELLKWAECVCVACGMSRYAELADLVRAARFYPSQDFAQAMVTITSEVIMPCGVGACEVCRVNTIHGEKHACVDGPVFDLLELGVRC